MNKDGDLLRVRGLTVSYPDAAPVVCDVSFAMRAGEAVCLAGESGSGKTQTALALMGLSPSTAHVAGSVSLGGLELLGAPEDVLNGCRARRIAMIFQDPMAALNPYLTIGDQLLRILVDHDLADGTAARTRVLGMLERVGLPDAERQYHAYPHELSGGMRQ
ncbi:MAG: ATP-binding cassette domain-containing protein, partial [Woeseiaceae bacterium]